MNDKRKKFWYLIGIGSLFLFLLILISSVLEVGDRLAKINIYVEISFYALVFLLFYFLILRPILIILLSPSFSVNTVLEKDSKKNYKLYKTISKNIIKSNYLKDNEKKMLSDSLGNYDKLKNSLSILYNSSIKREINKIIKKHAKTVMISTAINPNSKLDLITVFTVNLRMIKEIVLVCGYRPSYKNLSKLCLNVMGTALIAEGLENMNLDEILPKNFSSLLGEIPFLKSVVSGLTQGVANGLLTLRIGIVTRKYLFNEGEEVTKELIRRQSFKEALKLLPTIVSDSFSGFSSKLLNIRKVQD